jgi:predicted nucleic acid-binding Zn ribbon protein
MSFGDAVSYSRRNARRVGDVLPRLLREKRFFEKSRYGPLVEAWRQVVGEAVAARTRIVGYRRGRVTVEVDTAALMHELSGFQRSAILAELQRTPGGEDAADLRFRLGAEAPGRDAEE